MLPGVFYPRIIHGKYLAWSENWCILKGKNVLQKYFYESQERTLSGKGNLEMAKER